MNTIAFHTLQVILTIACVMCYQDGIYWLMFVMFGIYVIATTLDHYQKKDLLESNDRTIRYLSNNYEDDEDNNRKSKKTLE